MIPGRLPLLEHRAAVAFPEPELGPRHVLDYAGYDSATASAPCLRCGDRIRAARQDERCAGRQP